MRTRSCDDHAPHPVRHGDPRLRRVLDLLMAAWVTAVALVVLTGIELYRVTRQ